MSSASSQLHCVHFSSWDSNKDWSITLPSKESITTVAMGDGWVAVATNKHILRLFTVGGVQREIVSVPGAVVTLAGWGGRLAIIYQTGPCEWIEKIQYLDRVMTTLKGMESWGMDPGVWNPGVWILGYGILGYGIVRCFTHSRHRWCSCTVPCSVRTICISSHLRY